MPSLLHRILARLAAAPVLRWEVRGGIHRGVAPTAQVEIRPADGADPLTHRIEVIAADGRHWSLHCRAPIEDARDLAEKLVRENTLDGAAGAARSRAA